MTDSTNNTAFSATIDKPSYDADRYRIILQLEVPNGITSKTAYLDGKLIPTIGVGFNIREQAAPILTTLLRKILNRDPTTAETSAITKVANGTFSSNAQLQNALDAALRQITGNNTSTFSFANDQEIVDTFALIAFQIERRVNDWLTGIPNTRERIALLSLAYNNVVGPKQSPSLRQALIDGDRATAWYEIRYNSNGDQDVGHARRRFYESSLFGLSADLNNPTEEEVNSAYRVLTENRSKILAYENLWGLNPDGTVGSNTERSSGNTGLQNVVRDYGPILADANLSGVPTLQSQLDPLKAVLLTSLRTTYPDLADRLQDANWISTNIYLGGDQGETLDSLKYQTGIFEENGANDLIIGGVNADRLIGNKGNDFLIGNDGADVLEGGAGEDVLVGGDGADSLLGGDDNDTLNGDGGNDTLEGGAGDDTLDGGAGSDRLYGGDGFDVYRLRAGQANDSVIDSDGKGRIDFVDADGTVHTLDGGDLVQQVDGPNGYRVYRSADQRFTYTLEPDAFGAYTLTIRTGNDHIIVYGFHENSPPLQLDLGIALRGTTPLPEITTSFDIFGDLQPIDGEGHLVFDALGNVVTGGAAAPDRSDLLYGDTSNNRIVAGGGADGANGRGGDDILVGQGGSDVEFGEQGNDLLFAGLEVSVQDAIASSGNANSSGDSGGNQTFGLLSAAVLAGDNISAPIRGDFLDGGEGDDQLIGDIGDDNLKGGAGSDLIVGGAGDDVIFGDGYVVGSVSLNWQVERTTTTFTDGRATRYEITETGITEGELAPEAGGADVIIAGAGKDWIFANGGDDLVDAGSGDDVVFGGAGNETIAGGDGNDDLSGDQIDSGNATGGLSGALHGNDYINGGAGDDRIFGNGGADVLLGGDGDDTITGDDDVTSGVYHGDDFIDGGNGNDVLVGQGGADSLYGSVGDDQLQGDSTLLDGQFHGGDYLSGGDGNDVIFGQGGADTLDGGAGNDILQGDSTTLDGRYHGADALDGGDGNDQLIGQGGADALRGGAGDDLLFGDAGSSGGLAAVYEGNDYLDGGAGKDQLVGGGGNDTLLGGSGNDNLIGDQSGDTSVETANDGADYLDGGDGDDYLIGQGGNDTLLGGADADTLRGGSGDDYLDGGTGNDVLEGGSGNDIYFFGRGSGQDTVYNTSSSGGVDEVEIGSDVGPDDLILARSGNYLVALIAGTSDALVLADFFSGDDVAADAVSAIQFGDGTRWDQAAIKAKLLQGSDSDDALTGFSGADTLRGGDGNDRLLGAAGDDSLFGDAGNDVLDGGTGNDHLEGGLGSDIYQFGRGSGQDTIDNFTENDSTVGRQDTILLGAGIATTDVVTIRSGDDLILTINGTSDKLTVNGYFSADATTASAVDAIQFANGTLWTINTLKSRVLSGTTGNDTITGYATEDTLYGGNGDDVLDGADGGDYLYGGNGNDVLSGGSGSDYLSGEGGSDTYLFGRGSGQDIIYNYDESIGRQDIIQFAADVNAGDVVLVRSNNDLLLTISGTTDTLRVQNYFIGDGVGGFAVDAIRFADGTSWDIDTVKYKVLQGTAGNDVLLAYAAGSVVNGNDGNDYLYGNNGTDTLNGGTGNDFLFGRTGDDVLHGGAGNDYLQGDGGNDTYLFERSSGRDTIYNYDKTIGRQDAIQFAANINPSDIVLTRSGNDLFLAISGTTDTLLVQGYFNGDGASGYAVDEIRFADGTNWSIDNVKEKLLQGTEGNDYLYAYTAGSIVSGRGGNDTLIGNNGTDTLYGDAGNDTLYGGAGNDVLDGGSGFDVLRGEAGNDIYLFGRNYGQARIDNYDATVGRQDVVRFSSDVTADDVIASRSNTDLVLTITGTSDTLTVISYFQSDNFNAYAVNEIQFADGTTWSFDTIQTKVLIATEGNDSLYALTTGGVLSGLGGNDYLIGNIGSDTFYGNDGNDSLYGGSGNDVLYGGSGNDTLNAGDGVDVLDGGAGNDYLLGGIGNNTFLFGRGSGYDTINDARTTSSAFDVIQFSTDVAPGDVGIFRSGDNLVVSIVGTDDKI